MWDKKILVKFSKSLECENKATCLFDMHTQVYQLLNGKGTET